VHENDRLAVVFGEETLDRLLGDVELGHAHARNICALTKADTCSVACCRHSDARSAVPCAEVGKAIDPAQPIAAFRSSSTVASIAASSAPCRKSRGTPGARSASTGSADAAGDRRTRISVAEPGAPRNAASAALPAATTQTAAAPFARAKR